MGIRVSVYRFMFDAQDSMFEPEPDRFGARDCTRDGISSRATHLTVVNADGPFEPYSNAPAVLLVNHYADALSLVPAQRNEKSEWEPVPGWHMAGGNYGATSDARFGEACERLTGKGFYGAVAIHDRKEH